MLNPLAVRRKIHFSSHPSDFRDSGTASARFVGLLADSTL